MPGWTRSQQGLKFQRKHFRNVVRLWGLKTNHCLEKQMTCLTYRRQADAEVKAVNLNIWWRAITYSWNSERWVKKYLGKYIFFSIHLNQIQYMYIYIHVYFFPVFRSLLKNPVASQTLLSLNLDKLELLLRLIRTWVTSPEGWTHFESDDSFFPLNHRTHTRGSLTLNPRLVLVREYEV